MPHPKRNASPASPACGRARSGPQTLPEEGDESSLVLHGLGKRGLEVWRPRHEPGLESRHKLRVTRRQIGRMVDGYRGIGEAVDDGKWPRADSVDRPRGAARGHVVAREEAAPHDGAGSEPG